MKKVVRYSIIIAACVTVFLAMLFQNNSVKYPLDDCIIYFDDEARYQLIDINNYHIQDVKQGNTIFTNVTGYAFCENVLYVEFNEFVGYDGKPQHDNARYEHSYGTYNLITEEKVTHSKLDEFEPETQNIFHNKKVMNDLDTDKSRWAKRILKFIPLRYHIR